MREEREGRLKDLDLLVLPELAFTGYNFTSLAAIAPFLEPTASGPSTRWASRTATRLGCTVAVGYPEAAPDDNDEVDGHPQVDDSDVSGGNFNTIYDRKITASHGQKAYNSLVFVNHLGDVVAHYRKSFLYYTDETWAQEGKDHFWAGVLPLGSGNRAMQTKAAVGICMDINPYKFEAPWTAYEFANHARESKARLVIVSMAWLTRLSHEEVMDNASEPDMQTVAYWLERFQPLLGPKGSKDEVVIVCANRTGEEGVDERIGEVRYAGSSCVMGLTNGEGGSEGNVRIWDVLGRGESGLLIVDTSDPASYGVQGKPRAEPQVGETPVHNEEE